MQVRAGGDIDEELDKYTGPKIIKITAVPVT